VLVPLIGLKKQRQGQEPEGMVHGRWCDEQIDMRGLLGNPILDWYVEVTGIGKI
jgi:hypothetical protein